MQILSAIFTVTGYNWLTFYVTELIRDRAFQGCLRIIHWWAERTTSCYSLSVKWAASAANCY